MIETRWFSLGILALAGIFVVGCAAKGPLLVNPTYQAPESLVAGSPKIIVALSPFKDQRGVPPSVIGQKLSSSAKKQNDLVVRGTVADLVASSLQDALEKRGVTVKIVPSWDLTDKTIPATDADILIGGEILKLWVDAKSGALNAKYTGSVQMRVFIVDVRQKRIVRKVSPTTSVERKDVSFSIPKVDMVLSELLSSSVDQLMDDAEFKKNLE